MHFSFYGIPQLAMKLMDNARNIVFIQERQQLRVTKSNDTITSLLVVCGCRVFGAGRETFEHLADVTPLTSKKGMSLGLKPLRVNTLHDKHRRSRFNRETQVATDARGGTPDVHRHHVTAKLFQSVDM